MKLRSFLSLWTAACVVASTASAQPASKPLFDDPIVAKAKGGITVKLSEVEEEFVAFKSTMAASGKPVANEQRDEFMKKILDRVITIKLVMQRASAEDKAKANEKVKTLLDESIKRAGSEQVFNRQIETSGISVPEWKAKLIERVTVDEVFNREVKSQIVIDDAQVRKYYEANPEKFRQKDTYKILYLLKLTVDPLTIASPQGPVSLPEAEHGKKRAELEKIQARIKAGEDFSTLAKELSEDTGSKPKGGEVLFQRGQLLPDLEAEIVKLAPNQVSDIIKTSLGFQLVKLLEVTPEHLVDLPKVQDRVKDFLAGQEADRQAPAFVEKLKKEGGLEILDPKLKP